MEAIELIHSSDSRNHITYYVLSVHRCIECMHQGISTEQSTLGIDSNKQAQSFATHG